MLAQNCLPLGLTTLCTTLIRCLGAHLLFGTLSFCSIFLSPSDDTRNHIKMNGAELPCGTALRVEPSDPLYKLRKSKEQNNSYGPASKSTLLLEAPEMEEKVEDLDDFFATLDGEDETEQGKTIEESSTPNKEGDEDEDDLDGFFESLS